MNKRNRVCVYCCHTVTLIEAKLGRNDTHSETLIRVPLGNGSVESSHAGHTQPHWTHTTARSLTLAPGKERHAQ